jgi:endoglucanase
MQKFPLRLITLLLTTTAFLSACQAGRKPEPSMQYTYLQGLNTSHYLSQLYGRPFAEPGYLARKDMAWIAARGYDHIRLPVDGSELLDASGRIRTERLPKVDEALRWAWAEGLGVVLDIHSLPGSTFSGDIDTRLFTSEPLQAQAEELWRVLATRYREAGPELRFELLNEPVADDSDLVTAFYGRLIPVIREVSPDRKVVLCSNKWGQIQTVEALEPLLGDKNLVVTVHYYEPHVFTHQKASWVGMDVEGFPPISFPGVVPDLSKLLPEEHYAHSTGGKKLSREAIAKDFDWLAQWAAKHAVEIYVGELGVIKKADPVSRENWYRAVVEEITKHGFGWAVWDYKGMFAVRDGTSGESTLVQEVLDTYLR